MTAQIGDRFQYKGQEYSIVAISAPLNFTPQDYGMIPEGRCTACWNGYWCTYEISEEGIILKNLYINSKDDVYPEINGVKAKGGTNRYMGHHYYRNVNLKLPYTGRILVGKDFRQEYYIHMGYQRAWAYDVLKEFVFENGNLVDVTEHSEVVKDMRAKLEKQVNASGNTEEDMWSAILYHIRCHKAEYPTKNGRLINYKCIL